MTQLLTSPSMGMPGPGAAATIAVLPRLGRQRLGNACTYRGSC